ncbi:cytochrome c [Desulfuromonas sp. AOP6]|nr:cytochrome c [Desulfuromonas sp. AOP6]
MNRGYQMKNRKSYSLYILVVLLIAGSGPFIVGGALVHAASTDEAAGVYQQPVKPLTTLDCAQCHMTVFTDIRDGGGKHQLHCAQCHETFHTWKPGRDWQQVVPQCATCHGETHGPNFKACLQCHLNAHAPVKSLTDLKTLAKNCNTCHDSQVKELTQFNSQHTLVSCAECHHTRHGYKPGCNECHPSPHTPFVSNPDCLSCHPVHSPRRIEYGKEVSNLICASCHGEVAALHKASPRKHANLSCVFCHVDSHGHVPECATCHGAPHSEAMLKKFTGCQACHGDAHSLALPAN